MKELLSAEQVTADRHGWLKRRREGVCASDTGALLRLRGAYGSPYALWREKTGRETGELPSTKRMQFGLYCENYAAWEFEDAHTELHVTPGGLYAHDGRPWQMATFDRLAHYRRHCGEAEDFLPAEPDVTVQLKIDDWRDYKKTGVPAAYRAQVIQEMDIAAAEAGYLVVLNTSAAEIATFVIERDVRWYQDRDLIEEAGYRFLTDYVQADRPPPVDGLPATIAALKRQFTDLDPDKRARVPLWKVRWWRLAARAEEAAKLRKERWLNELRLAAGDAGIWTVFDPRTGMEEVVASHSASPRAGYSVDPKERVDTVRPSRTWQP